MPTTTRRARKTKIDFLKASQNVARFRELGKPMGTDKAKDAGN